MLVSPAQTIADFLKQNIKRVLEYWTQLTFTLGVFGAAFGVFTIYVYIGSIGRTDLFMSVIDVKSTLVIWLLIISILMIACLAALTVSAWFYGLAIAMFEAVPDKQREISCWLLVPIVVGFTLFVILMFFCSSSIGGGGSLAIVFLATLIVYGSLFLSNRFRRIVDRNVSSFERQQKVAFLVVNYFIVLIAVVLAVIPASFILGTYVGADTSEAIYFVAVLTLATLVLSLAPALAFYILKGSVYQRATYGFVVAIFLLMVFFAVSRGAMSSITYTAAKNLQVRQTVPAKFVLGKEIKLTDLDNLQWHTRLQATNQVEVEAFQLLSFGDVLLLCPRGLLGHGLHELPSYTPLLYFYAEQ